MGGLPNTEAHVKCEVCGTGERRSELIRYSLSLGDQLVIVEHVPTLVCSRCGEISLAPEVVERLQNTIWQSGSPARVVETPVYEFA